MNLIEITNKSGKIKLNDIVQQPVMDRLISEIGKIFGANAAESGQYTGELINCYENAVDTLEIEIHSPGGSVLDGYTLYSEIKKMQARGVHVTATINSLAASMASVIAMAADKIRMVPNGRMMIHDVQTGIRGNAQELRKQADLIDDMSNEIADIYANRTGATTEAMRGKMKEETWMSAKVALAEKFIDEIYDPADAKKTVDIADAEPTSRDMSLLARLTNPSDTEAQERIVALEASISQHDQVIADYEAKLAIAETALAEVEVVRAENVSLTAQVATIPDLEASIAQLTEKAEITETKIGEAAAQLLAAQGHGAPVDLSGTAVAEGEKQNLLEQYASLSGVEKREFLAKHAAELRQLEREKP